MIGGVDAGRGSGPSTGRGTPVVVGLLVLAIGLALFAVWFQWRQTRRCLAFYGSETTRLIQRGARVEVWMRSSGGGDPAGPGARGPVVERYDVSNCRGLVHLRRGLVEDANLDWSRLDGQAVAPGDWELALAFFGDDAPGAAAPDAVLLISHPVGGEGQGPMLGIEGRAGRVGLGRLAAGLERWWQSARTEAVPVGAGGPLGF